MGKIISTTGMLVRILASTLFVVVWLIFVLDFSFNDVYGVFSYNYYRFGYFLFFAWYYLILDRALDIGRKVSFAIGSVILQVLIIAVLEGIGGDSSFYTSVGYVFIMTLILYTGFLILKRLDRIAWLLIAVGLLVHLIPVLDNPESKFGLALPIVLIHLFNVVTLAYVGALALRDRWQKKIPSPWVGTRPPTQE